MGEVVKFRGETKLDIDPDDVLEGAKGKLRNVVVLGFENNEEGTAYFASSMADGGDVLWLLESLKTGLLLGRF